VRLREVRLREVRLRKVRLRESCFWEVRFCEVPPPGMDHLAGDFQVASTHVFGIAMGIIAKRSKWLDVASRRGRVRVVEVGGGFRRASFVASLAASLAAMLLGGLTYVLHRPESLWMFRWFEALGLDGVVQAMRGSWLARSWRPPAWWIGSAPAALWLASGILALRAAWTGPSDPARPIWLLLLLGAAAAGELGQLVGVVPGTFDLVDLAAMTIAAAVALAWTGCFHPILRRNA